MAGKTAKIYKFRPLKTLTGLVLFFMAVKILGTASLIACQVYKGLTAGELKIDDLQDPVVAVYDLLSLVYLVVLVLSAFLTLMWVSGATRNTLAVRPGLPMSQLGAVGWWFVPFASLYKPYQYICEIWFTAQGNLRGRGTAAERPLAIWWLTFLGGNIVSYAVGKAAPTNWIGVTTGYGLTLVATVLFFGIVRTVGRNQKGQDPAMVEVF
jgi:hypothetical protein